MAQNRKFQDFVENKYMADDAIGNAETDANPPTHLRFLYDFAAVGGAVSAISLTAMDGTAQTLPGNAVVRNVVYEVVTEPASSGSATIALGILGNSDAFKAATAFDNAAYTAASHPHNEVPFKNGGAPVALLATIAAAALTAGKFILHVEYYEGQA